MILMITCQPINPGLHNCGVCASEPSNMHADMKEETNLQPWFQLNLQVNNCQQSITLTVN